MRWGDDHRARKFRRLSGSTARLIQRWVAARGKRHAEQGWRRVPCRSSSCSPASSGARPLRPGAQPPAPRRGPCPAWHRCAGNRRGSGRRASRTTHRPGHRSIHTGQSARAKRALPSAPDYLWGCTGRDGRRRRRLLKLVKTAGRRPRSTGPAAWWGWRDSNPHGLAAGGF